MRDQVLYFVLLVVISVVNSVGQIMMRWGGNQSTHASTVTATRCEWLWHSRWWLFGIGVTWICGLGWAWCLRRLPLVAALPIYSGLVYVLSVLGGACILKEKLLSIQAFGTLFILVGILLLTLSLVQQPSLPTSP
jgi:multidrug transporter EmrE-like cation transporter